MQGFVIAFWRFDKITSAALNYPNFHLTLIRVLYGDTTHIDKYEELN
jgi:hypothetical protein